MLGCIAQATSTEITIHDLDVEEVRWFSKEEVVELLARQQPPPSRPPPHQQLIPTSRTTATTAADASVTSCDVLDNKAGGDDDIEVNIPGEYAIAHHLIQSFVGNKVVTSDDSSKVSVPPLKVSPNSSNSSSSPRPRCRLHLFLIPVLMFLVNSKICLSINVIQEK
jgi:hypothetical protein